MHDLFSGGLQNADLPSVQWSCACVITVVVSGFLDGASHFWTRAFAIIVLPGSGIFLGSCSGLSGTVITDLPLVLPVGCRSVLEWVGFNSGFR